MVDVETVESREEETAVTTLETLSLVDDEAVPACDIAEHVNVLLESFVRRQHDVCMNEAARSAHGKGLRRAKRLASLENGASRVEQLVIFNNPPRLAVTLCKDERLERGDASEFGDGTHTVGNDTHRRRPSSKLANPCDDREGSASHLKRVGRAN